MIIAAIFLLFVNFTESGLLVLFLESSLIVAGYIMIIVQCFFPNFDGWSKIKRCFSRRENENIYDNIHYSWYT